MPSVAKAAVCAFGRRGSNECQPPLVAPTSRPVGRGGRIERVAGSSAWVGVGLRDRALSAATCPVFRSVGSTLLGTTTSTFHDTNQASFSFRDKPSRLRADTDGAVPVSSAALPLAGAVSLGLPHVPCTTGARHAQPEPFQHVWQRYANVWTQVSRVGGASPPRQGIVQHSVAVAPGPGSPRNSGYPPIAQSATTIRVQSPTAPRKSSAAVAPVAATFTAVPKGRVLPQSRSDNGPPTTTANAAKTLGTKPQHLQRVGRLRSPTMTSAYHEATATAANQRPRTSSDVVSVGTLNLASPKPAQALTIASLNGEHRLSPSHSQRPRANSTVLSQLL
eukprot:TRINITY_DN14682_c0_g1_i1.p1 TRINITY_DN14682_c0_g1~~TRINITY_DN14682_c0_g1_i1.p1  ORF type:complete len:334 (-),score=23.58 TRINITY_DN14682_c0_g1_i1:136-1137(-)